MQIRFFEKRWGNLIVVCCLKFYDEEPLILLNSSISFQKDIVNQQVMGFGVTERTL